MVALMVDGHSLCHGRPRFYGVERGSTPPSLKIAILRCRRSTRGHSQGLRGLPPRFTRRSPSGLLLRIAHSCSALDAPLGLPWAPSGRCSGCPHWAPRDALEAVWAQRFYCGKLCGRGGSRKFAESLGPLRPTQIQTQTQTQTQAQTQTQTQTQGLHGALWRSWWSMGRSGWVLGPLFG